MKLPTERGFSILHVKHSEGKPCPSCMSVIATAGSILPFLLPVAGKYLLTPWLRSSFSYLYEKMFHVVCFMSLINNIFENVVDTGDSPNSFNQICGTKHTFSVT